MSKNRRNNKVEDVQFEAEQNLTPPSEQVAEETTAQPAAKEAKPKNGFLAMLEEANAKRKARVKKYRDGK